MTANVNTAQQITKPSAAKLQIAHNAFAKATVAKPKLYVEQAIPYFDKVLVTYINEADLDCGNVDEDYWKATSILFSNIEKFAIAHHRLPDNYGDVSVSLYVDENLPTLVKEYLEAGKEEMSL